MAKLKYPKCEICKAIRERFHETDVPTEWLNRYHESNAIIDDLQKRVQDDVWTVVFEHTKNE